MTRHAGRPGGSRILLALGLAGLCVLVFLLWGTAGESGARADQLEPEPFRVATGDELLIAGATQRTPAAASSLDLEEPVRVEMTPEEWFLTLPFGVPPSMEAFHEDELRTRARRVGWAMIRMTFILEDGGEAEQALLRLRSVDSIAMLKGVTLTDAEREVIEATVIPKYSLQLKPLVPLAIKGINEAVLAQYDQGGYSLLLSGEVLTSSSMADYPDGGFRKETRFECAGTPYSILFDFNSAAFPALEGVLREIKSIKRAMQQEVQSMTN